MTDSDILEALEGQIYVSDTVGADYCNGVPKRFFVNILDLINRQKAEIERLEYCNSVNVSSIGTLHERLKEAKKFESMVSQNEGVLPEYEKLIKAEAIREFAERVKDLIYEADDINPVSETQIDNLVKEMVGDSDEQRKSV